MQEQADAPEIYCSLTSDEFRQRRSMARKALLPHLVEARRLECGLRLVFPESDALRSKVEEFIALERQCCATLTFAASPPEEGLIVTIQGPPEAAATIELFANAISDSLKKSMQNDVNWSTRDPKLRRTGIAGIALGILALIACELPIILTLIGLGSLGAAVSTLKPPLYIESAGVIVIVAGLLLLFICVIHSRRSSRKRDGL